MLAHLDNETVFKKAFTNKAVFKAFVKDIVGIDIEVDKIETEKRFKPKMGNIDMVFDIFAESIDQRVVIEIQRIDYDYNFDRFLGYFISAILEQQRRSADYTIARQVYMIIVLTAPYKIDPVTHTIFKDEVLISSCDPRNLKDESIPVYGHKLIFLNPNFRQEITPPNYRDWLDLIYESIHNPEDYKVNLNNEGIRMAVELIDFDNLDAEEVRQSKINEQKKVVLRLMEQKGFEVGIEVGKKEGIEVGKKDSQLEIATAMKQNGVDIHLIVKYTGLTQTEVEAI